MFGECVPPHKGILLKGTNQIEWLFNKILFTFLDLSEPLNDGYHITVRKLFFVGGILFSIITGCCFGLVVDFGWWCSGSTTWRDIETLFVTLNLKIKQLLLINWVEGQSSVLLHKWLGITNFTYIWSVLCYTELLSFFFGS